MNAIIAKPEEKQEETEEEVEKKAKEFLQYCGKLTEKFECALKWKEAPCTVIMTL